MTHPGSADNGVSDQARSGQIRHPCRTPFCPFAPQPDHNDTYRFRNVPVLSGYSNEDETERCEMSRGGEVAKTGKINY